MQILEGRIRGMSLNIKNEATHAKVRRLAELTGTSMTAAVDDAVERRLQQLGDDPEAERRAERRAEIDQLMARIAEVFTPEAIAENKRFEQELYDENGLPQ